MVLADAERELKQHWQSSIDARMDMPCFDIRHMGIGHVRKKAGFGLEPSAVRRSCMEVGVGHTYLPNLGKTFFLTMVLAYSSESFCP